MFEEHLYTEAMQSVLRNAINSVPEAGATPRVLLTTLPFEARHAEPRRTKRSTIAAQVGAERRPREFM